MDVGNSSIMAALDAGCAGCARTTRPLWYTYAPVKGRAIKENAVTPLSVSFCFLSVFSLSSFFSLSTWLLPQVFPFLQLNTINHGLHFSRSTPLRKTLTVNHYLCIEYFQKWTRRNNGKTSHDWCFSASLLSIPGISTEFLQLWPNGYLGTVWFWQLQIFLARRTRRYWAIARVVKLRVSGLGCGPD